MTLFDTRNKPALQHQLQQHSGLLIACYCAAWCDTCRDYQSEFSTLSTQWPQHTFVWIDIEDDPHLLDDHDVDNFPTILIQSDKGNLFFGEQLPYISHLDRLIDSVQQADSETVDHGPKPLQDLLNKA